MAETGFPLALVTGAAHRLGRAFALRLGQLGYALLLHYNSAGTEARSTLEDIQALGVPTYSFQADLTQPEAIDSLFSYVDSLPQPLQILVNSAAVMRRQDIKTLPLEEWDSTLALNLRAPFLLAQRAAQRMQSQGLIVNITDSGASKSWTGFPAYIISKSGLDSLTRLLARALAPSIRVNAIAPGLVLPAEGMPESEWARLVGRLPLQRQSRVDDVASALEFLVQNRSITGQTIVVDGGYSLIG